MISRDQQSSVAESAGEDLGGPEVIPSHVCIIMDGNHRWARKRRLPGAAGHRAGAKMLRRVAEAAADLGVQHLTLFAFSTENWERPDGEVRLLMDLMRHVMENDLAELNARGVRLKIIGDKQRFDADIRLKMDDCEALTEGNTRLYLNVAVNFGGRWDIVRTAQTMAREVQRGTLYPSDIDESIFGRYTSLGGVPDPDLLIRTGGEHRISNFLLWDLAYTELYFTDVFWPDFDETCLRDAIKEFVSRSRRYGARS